MATNEQEAGDGIRLAVQDAEATGRRQRGGGKLNRSETVTVRLDPKLNYLCELAARAQRRTKSSFIEWAIEHALKGAGIPGERRNAATGELWTIDDRNMELWDTEEPDRVVALAYLGTSLLTHEEQLIWKLIITSGWYWKGRWDEDDGQWVYDADTRWNLIMDRVREHWDLIKAVAEGSEKRSDHYMFRPLTKNQVVSSSVASATFDDDLDSDVPF